MAKSTKKSNKDKKPNINKILILSVLLISVAVLLIQRLTSTKGDIVLRFAENDPTLLDDIQKEREILDKVYDDYKDTITHWYYGHYHASKIEEINGCIFRLLDIGEFSRHVTDNYGFL